MAAVSEPVVVFLHRGSWADRYQAVTLALTAAALGDRVTIALFFEPLRLWAEGRFDEGAPPQAAEAKVGGLSEVLDEGRRELGVRVVACDTALRLASVTPQAARLDGVMSLPALWRLAHDGRAVVV
jgi:peroxiredoxin family protein